YGPRAVLLRYEVDERASRQLAQPVSERALPGRVGAHDRSLEVHRAEEIAAERVEPAGRLLEPALLGEVDRLDEGEGRIAGRSRHRGAEQARPNGLPVGAHEPHLERGQVGPAGQEPLAPSARGAPVVA